MLIYLEQHIQLIFLKKYGFAKELNHSNPSTTSNHYIKIEKRDLLYKEEEEIFDKNLDTIIKGIDEKIKFKIILNQS